jgi:predicted dehydrogenase
MELTAVCDTSTLVLEVFKKYSNTRCYTDYRELFEKEEIDSVVVATPTKLHFPIVKLALEKGVHVFCEKPFSLTTAEGEELVRLATEKQLINQVGYHNRHIGTFNYFKELIENEVIGEVYHFIGEAYGPVVVKKKGGTWRSDSAEGGGCLFDYASHVINLVEYILGRISDVDGTQLKKIYSKGVEDAVYSALMLDNGITGNLSVNWSDETYRKMSTQISVLGTEGKIISDAQEIKIYLKKENKKFGLDRGWNIKYITDLTESVEFYLRGEEYSAQIESFARSVAGEKKENNSTFQAALETDKVIEMLMNYKK